MDLAGEEMARLPLPMLVMEHFERLSPIKDKFRVTVGNHSLGRRVVPIVLE